MGIYELRQKYGTNKKAGQAVNAAVRAEIPGGERVLKLVFELQCSYPKHSPAVRAALEPVLNELILIRQEMLSAVAEKYALASTKNGENDGKIKSRTAGQTSPSEKGT